MKFSHSQEKGFTLIELLVVISIIGLLSSVVLSGMNQARAKSRNAKRLQDLVQMRTALELYAIDNGGLYPANTINGVVHPQFVTSDPGCYTSPVGHQDGADLVVMASGLVSGKYISKIPQDPKPGGAGHCYLYVTTPDRRSYKFTTAETVEGSYDPRAANHPYHDPWRPYSYAIKTAIDPED